MTIRLLEDGDYRLQEHSVMVRRTLENGGRRLFEDRVSSLLVQSSIVEPAYLEESGRTLESGYLRNTEDGGTRDMEDALCAACMKPCNCNLGLSGLNLFNQIISGSWVGRYSFNMYCGNYQGSASCFASYQAFLVVPLFPPPSRVIWQSSCYIVPTAIPCGSMTRFSGSIGGSVATGSRYRLEIAAWNGTVCNGGNPNAWPAAYLSQDFQVPLS